ncbi:helix-turn-helix transcriptional regulator [Lactobacillus reuteri]|nr:helix-turn-helix transcriptional regulator [Limosilactobacillus reuteri]NMV55486.1 helix-turn-helix transcriptional regulator [Limosilactobacillus reuteri]NMV65184.1 helix-turn-helix transcriptional regulator [Limosilactobacillus reuteri]
MQLQCNYFCLKEGGNLKSNPDIGSRIKQVRLKNGKSQEDFGSLFDPPVNKASVSRWESGKTLPTSKRLQKIAELGGVSVEYLINGSRLNSEAIQKLLKKAIHGVELTKSEQQKINESQLDYIDSMSKIRSRWKTEAYNQIEKQQAIIESKPMLLEDLQLYSDMITLFNMVRLYGTEEQKTEFGTWTSIIKELAAGTLEYDREFVLSNIDKLLSSFPVKKD